MKSRKLILLVILMILCLTMIKVIFNHSKLYQMEDISQKIVKKDSECEFYVLNPSNYFTAFSNAGTLKDIETEPNYMQIFYENTSSETSIINIEYVFDLESLYYMDMEYFKLGILGSDYSNISTNHINFNNIKVQIYNGENNSYQTVYTLKSTNNNIRKELGYIGIDLTENFTISSIINDLINPNMLKINLICEYSYNQPTNSIQFLWIYLIEFSIGKNIETKRVNATSYQDYTDDQFHLTGSLSNINSMDNKTIKVLTSNIIQYQIVHCNFSIEYDLNGLQEIIYGLRFDHFCWAYGADVYIISSTISVYNYSSNQLLPICEFDEDPNDFSNNVTPLRYNSSISLENTFLINDSKIKIYYYAELMNNDPDPSLIGIEMELASVLIFRERGPIIESINVIDKSVYIWEDARINGCIWSGENPISEIILMPDNELITTSEGYFDFLITSNTVGEKEYTIKAIDTGGYSKESLPFNITYNKRPTIVSATLEEIPNPSSPELNLSLVIKDGLSLEPLPNYFFSVLIEKENEFFKEYKNLQCDINGKYKLIQSIDKNEYLDTQYNFTINSENSINYNPSIVSEYIIPSEGGINVSIIDYNFKENMYAGEDFNLTVNVDSFRSINSSELILNETIIEDLDLKLGTNELKIKNNRAGTCNYKVRAKNNDGFTSTSDIVTGHFKPNPIIILARCNIDTKKKMISINLSIINQRLNDYAKNISINLALYDYKHLLLNETIPYIDKYTIYNIPFDSKDHNFKIIIGVSETTLYESQVLDISGLKFDYDPYPFPTNISITIIAFLGIFGLVIRNKRVKNHIKIGED
ncbi:MAG: hypothetical protein GF329_16200 [Candidatus Lokiarchaeota archaeon]|nr:hypothetical protein [Candidatus Lokiarchaeota archaeon]